MLPARWEGLGESGREGRRENAKAARDRTSLCQSVGMLNRLEASLKFSFELSGAEGRKQAEYRSKYQFVVKL